MILLPQKIGKFARSESQIEKWISPDELDSPHKHRFTNEINNEASKTLAYESVTPVAQIKMSIKPSYDPHWSGAQTHQPPKQIEATNHKNKPQKRGK